MLSPFLTTKREKHKEEEEKEEMKLVWSPETASKAYIDTIKSGGLTRKSSVAEMLSAMAGGWNAKLIVEAWFNGDEIATSIGLGVAARHTGGRHVCVVPNERSRLAYINAMQNSGLSLPEVMVGEAKDMMEKLDGIEFLVVDSRRKDFTKVFRLAKLSHLGAVLVSKNASQWTISGFRWSELSARRVVRSVILPLGNGLEIAYVAGKDGNNINSRKIPNRWIRQIDHRSGEEHVFRR